MTRNVDISYVPVSRISIHTIHTSCHTQRGFDSRGCFGSDCHDACCQYGADIDFNSYDLIQMHVGDIERIVGSSCSTWFEEGSIVMSSEFLGGGSVRSRVGDDGYCVFHVPGGKGCALYQLAFSGVDLGIVPSICRLYPLTWDKGVLQASTHLEPTCNCVFDTPLESVDGSLSNDGVRRSILYTQRRDVADIFQVQELYTIDEPRRRKK